MTRRRLSDTDHARLKRAMRIWRKVQKRQAARKWDDEESRRKGERYV